MWVVSMTILDTAFFMGYFYVFPRQIALKVPQWPSIYAFFCYYYFFFLHVSVLNMLVNDSLICQSYFYAAFSK